MGALVPLCSACLWCGSAASIGLQAGVIDLRRLLTLSGSSASHCSWFSGSLRPRLLVHPLLQAHLLMAFWDLRVETCAPGEYLDTYFRLLREDCLFSIRQSLADLRDRGEAAQRAREDQNVFRAKLKGFTISRGECDGRLKAHMNMILAW